MKKIMLSLALILGLLSTAFAQNKNVKFGIKAGLTFPEYRVSGTAAQTLGDPQANPSFFVGGLADISVSSQLSIQPGLSLIGKGVKYKSTGTENIGGTAYSYTGSVTINTMYIEIPVNLVGNIPVAAGNLFLGAGPYFGYALSGESKSKISVSGGGTSQSDSAKEDVEFGSGEDEMKRTEFGVNFLGGYQLKNGLNLNLGYGLGLSNLANTSAGEGKVSNRVFSIGLGFLF